MVSVRQKINIVDRKSFSSAINQAADTLKNGGVILHPTETVYGLAANIFDDDAVRKIYELKNRPFSKPLSIMVSSVEHIKKLIGNVSSFSERILEQVFPAPITVILPLKKNIDATFFYALPSIGFRISENSFCRALTEKISFPIVTTSANKSGENPPIDAKKVEKNFAESLDLIVDSGITKFKESSTIIDLSMDTFQVIRDGPYNLEQIKIDTKK